MMSFVPTRDESLTAAVGSSELSEGVGPPARPHQLVRPTQRRITSPRARIAKPPGPAAIDAGPVRNRFAYVVRRDAHGRVRLRAAWPLWALLVLYPLWWAIGVGSFAFPLAAIPMAAHLVRSRPIRKPRGLWLWIMFLGWTVISLVMLSGDPAGTHSGSRTGRLISIAVTLAEYGGATVTLLFVGNLSERQLPRERLMRWLSILFLTTLAGGWLGTLAPHFQFSAPLEYLLPGSLRSSSFIAALVHPNAAQVQSVLGEPSGRAAAPFGYTNFWANNFSLLLVWFVVAWGLGPSRLRRAACVACVVAAAVPVVYSLNRGLWIGIGLSALWVAVRVLMRGRLMAIIGMGAIALVGLTLFVFTPLQHVYESRLANGKSNSIRTYLTENAISAARQSPIVGWGAPRKTNGSNQSIAVGPTPSCGQCGAFPTGSVGQLWYVLFNNGFVGAIWFVSFFVFNIWTYRRDRTPIGQAGILVIGLTLLYSLFYNSVPAALTITMISIGLLWRSDLVRDVERVRETAIRPRRLRESSNA